MALSFLEGNEAVAWGAVASGCRFFAGYPITPATTVYNTMLKLLPPEGGICMQCEDEIASIGCCLGASMAGMKVMTATSGPGISLYSENISLAIGSEIPIVIIDVQRLAPSTGSATRGADGDVQFLRWGSSGGLPVIVLAPADVRDCFTLTMDAFNLAEEFRCPVFVASNKEIAMTRESLDLDHIEKPEVIDRAVYSSGDGFLPFKVYKDQVVPDFLPIGDKSLVRQTSSTHGPDGYITTSPDVISASQTRLMNKLNSTVNRYSFHETSIEDSDTMILTYGVTARAAREAGETMKKEGKPVSLMVLKTLWPVPEELIKEKTKNTERVLVVEMNMGQYVNEIKRILPDKRIGFLGQMDGRLITPQRIMEEIKNV